MPIFAVQIFNIVSGLGDSIDSMEGKFLEPCTTLGRAMSSLCCKVLRWIAGKLLELLSSVMIKLQESFIANFEFTKSFSNTEPMFLKVVGMKREVNMFFQAPDALITKC